MAIRTKLKLELNINELSDTAKEILRHGFQIDDDENHLWLSLSDILDNVDEIFLGVPAKFDGDWDKIKVTDIPKAWWKAMAFSPAMTKAMKKFWKENPTGEIEWTW